MASANLANSSVRATTKNESRKLLTDEMPIKDAVQDSAFENLWAIPSDLSARNADVVLDEMKKNKKKLRSLVSGLKEFDLFNDSGRHLNNYYLIPLLCKLKRIDYYGL